MCCCCFAYACSDGRQTSEYNIKNYLGDLYVVDISSIQELTQQSNMKLQGSRLMESFEVDDKTLLSLNPKLMSRRKSRQRDIFRRSSHMQATTADLLQMEIYEVNSHSDSQMDISFEISIQFGGEILLSGLKTATQFLKK